MVERPRPIGDARKRLTSAGGKQPPIAAEVHEYWSYTSPMLSAALWLLPHLTAAAASIAAAVVDIRELRLPNRLVAIVGASAALLGVIGVVLGEPAGHLVTMLIGSMFFAAPLGVIWMIAPASLGFGDVKYAAAAGAFLGWYTPVAALWALAGSFMIAAPVAVLLAFTKGRKALMPLGPFLVASSLVVGATEFSWPA